MPPLHSIAVIGQPNYASKAVSGCCGGSSDVIPLYTVLPLQGVQNALQAPGSSASANLTIVNTDVSNLDQAVAAAKAADAVIVLAGTITEERADRPNLTLPDYQDAMIRRFWRPTHAPSSFSRMAARSSCRGSIRRPRSWRRGSRRSPDVR